MIVALGAIEIRASRVDDDGVSRYTAYGLTSATKEGAGV
jgi:hypothetical protein